MAIAASLWFDSALEAAVRAAWNELSRRGISGSMLAGPCRPHVTLGVWEHVHVPRFADDLRELAGSTAPLPIALDAVSAFEQAESVAWLRPAGGAALTALQRRVHAIGSASGSGPHAFQLPAAWTPHVTCAWGLSRDALADAVACLESLPLPLSGRGIAIGIIDTPAEIELERIELRS